MCTYTVLYNPVITLTGSLPVLMRIPVGLASRAFSLKNFQKYFSEGGSASNKFSLFRLLENTCYLPFWKMVFLDVRSLVGSTLNIPFHCLWPPLFQINIQPLIFWGRLSKAGHIAGHCACWGGISFMGFLKSSSHLLGVPELIPLSWCNFICLRRLRRHYLHVQ